MPRETVVKVKEPTFQEKVTLARDRLADLLLSATDPTYLGGVDIVQTQLVANALHTLKEIDRDVP